MRTRPAYRRWQTDDYLCKTARTDRTYTVAVRHQGEGVDGAISRTRERISMQDFIVRMGKSQRFYMMSWAQGTTSHGHDGMFPRLRQCFCGCALSGL